MSATETTATRQTAIECLAHFIATAPKRHEKEALARSRRAVLDTIGCMLAGITEPVAQTALATVSGWGKGTATVVGSDATLPPPWAALVNGSAAKAFDYDDWDDPGITHTTAVLLPAILAAFAGKEASGHDLLDAHIVGVEAIARIGETVNPNHYARGWHSTSTIGAIGAAAACARALGLNAEQTANALSFSTSMAGGFTSQFGTMAKPMHAGFAAKAGLISASLASHGGTAHADALDGPVSFASTMSDAAQVDFDRAMTRLGNPWSILENGLHVKLYPSCGGTHRVVEAALALREKHSLTADAVKSVELNVQDYVAELLPYDMPDDTSEALFSFPYCVAAALVRGRLGIGEFSVAAVNDAEIRDLAGRIRVTSRDAPDRSRLFLNGDPDTVTVLTRAGETLTAAVDVPAGAPPRFADDALVEHKFFGCVSGRVSAERADNLRDLVLGGTDEWPLGDLQALLAGDTSTP